MAINCNQKQSSKWLKIVGPLQATLYGELVQWERKQKYIQKKKNVICSLLSILEGSQGEGTHREMVFIFIADYERSGVRQHVASNI